MGHQQGQSTVPDADKQRDDRQTGRQSDRRHIKIQTKKTVRLFK